MSGPAKHWVRLATACNNNCQFCLDGGTPRDLFVAEDDVRAELSRGREDLEAEHAVLSGGEATLHPAFPAFVRYARDIGYERVQVITNGSRFASRAFYDDAMAAGLGEITFSLHGDTADLHDELTRTKGSFDRLIKGMLRALRDPEGPIVNVDICVNQQNVDRIDRIVELCVSMGVGEFDLLHLVPHGNAFVNRDRLFYDPREHMAVLRKVLALNRHPRFHVWTNRFPPAFLEGAEHAIQDPHKLLDEVNGRRFVLRRYLDLGEPMDCRDPERCSRCFVAPFCDTMDAVISRQNTGTFEVWEGEGALPFGCTRRRVTVETMDEFSHGVEARVRQPGPVPEVSARLIADSPEALDAWLTEPLPAGVEVLVELNRATARWMLDHRDALAQHPPGSVKLDQPSHEHIEDTERDIEELADFFWRLDLPLPTSGLPPCLAPNMPLVEPVRRLSEYMFEDGRLSIPALARHHLAEHNRTWSLRCEECAVRERCPGISLNMARSQGYSLLRRIREGPGAEAARRQLAGLPVRHGVAEGRPPEPAAPSLPGFEQPVSAPEDPLSLLACENE